MPIPGREVLQVEPASSSDATVQIVEYDEDPLRPSPPLPSPSPFFLLHILT